MHAYTRRTFVTLGAAAAAAALLGGCASRGPSPVQLDNVSADVGSGPAPEQEPDGASTGQSPGSPLLLACGTQAGVYYELGQALAKRSSDGGRPMTALVSNGSAANIAALQGGRADFAFCQLDVAAAALEGDGAWDELGDGGQTGGFSLAAVLYDELLQVYSNDDEVDGVSDFDGLSVSVGALASGTRFSSNILLGAYGLSEADLYPVYEGIGDSVSSLASGVVDAAAVMSGVPAPALGSLPEGGTVALLGVDDERAAAIAGNNPLYRRASIPARTVSGQEAEIPTLAVDAVLLARDDATPDDVYALVSGIFEDIEALADASGRFAAFTVERASSATAIPYHPGAARYYAEKLASGAPAQA